MTAAHRLCVFVPTYDNAVYPVAAAIATRVRGDAMAPQRFARRLEHFVRRAPDNWFNFYDFWERS